MAALRRACCALLLLAGALAAQSAPTAANTTEAERGIGRALDLILARPASDRDYARTVLFVLDRTASLQNAGFAGELRAALQRHAPQLAGTSFALEGFGGDDVAGLAPTDDPQALLAACEAQLARPDAEFHDAFAAVRAHAPRLAQGSGQRVLVLVTFDNADVESELEKTTALLQHYGITTHVISSECYLADSYWDDKSYRQAPRGAELRGSDAALVDLPWGWLFQEAIANEISPAGFTTYGLGRLAAATGGRVFVFTPPDETQHRCAIYGQCLFCTGDHVQELETYFDGRLARIAPSLASRREALQELALDPWFRATFKLWEEAARAKLIRSWPAVKFSSSGLVPNRARTSSWPSWISTLSFERNARQADRLRKECRTIREDYENQLASLDPADGAPRQRAIADYTRLALRLTEINLLAYAAWAREIAPQWTARGGQELEGPELPEIPEGRRPVGVSFRTLCLCHGVRPFEHVELPGGEELRAGLRELEIEVARYREAHGHTPFAVALHRSGIARFHLTYQGITTNPERPRSRSKSPDDPTTTTGRGRPQRAGGSSGGSSGPTTGGGR